MSLAATAEDFLHSGNCIGLRVFLMTIEDLLVSDDTSHE